MDIRHVAVIGTGTVGAAWAAYFAARGLRVRLFDANPKALESGLGKARGLLPQLTEDPAAAERLQAAADAREALADAEFVQESVFERYEIKRAVHAEIERHAPASAIVASSSSGLLASRMQEGWTHPERFLVAHPFNPAHLVPLVELVGGPKTSPETMQAARAFYEAVGKVPVVLRKEVPGHLANRMATAVWREAIALVADGVASLEDVDKAICAGPGLRWAFMGQHLTYHLAGGPGGYANFFAHLGPALETYMEDMAAWTRIPEDAKREVIAQMEASLAGRDPVELEAWRDRKLAEVTALMYPSKEVGRLVASNG